MPQSSKNVTIDSKNRQILQILIENARTPITVIAKNVHLSKASVQKRIKKMIDKKVIYNFIPVTNPYAWGYHLIFLLMKTDALYEDQDASIIKNAKYVWLLTKHTGQYNFSLIFCVKDTTTFYQTFGELQSKIHLNNWKIFPVEAYDFEPYQLLGVSPKVKEKPRKQTLKELDETDAAILKELRFNARASLITLSQKIGISTERIKRRITALYQRKAIHRFFTNFDIFSTGFIPYFLILKVKDTRKNNVIRQFLLTDKHTNGVYSLQTEWNIMTIIEFTSIQDMRNWTESLIKNFPEIADYEIYHFVDQLICDLFPEAVYQEILNNK